MGSKNDGIPSLTEILGRRAEMSETQKMPADEWPMVTAERIALLHLYDCKEQLARSETEALRLVQAAKSAHLALQAALTAALAGSMGIGAYTDKVESEWRDFLQEGGPQPKGRRIMHFEALLNKARTKNLEWTQRPLTVSDADATLLEKLTWIRHGVEHVHPGFWAIEPAYIHTVIPVAVRTALDALRTVTHHFEPGEIEQAEKVVDEISLNCVSH